MAQCGAEAGSHAPKNLFGIFVSNSTKETTAKAAAIMAKYQSKITAAEQELCSWTGQVGAEPMHQNKYEKLDANAESLNVATRTLAYEIDIAQHRGKVEEARGALWAVWSEAAELRSTHRPKELSIITALKLLIAIRRKMSAAVQSCVKNEEAECSNMQIPAWLKNEPAWPADIKQDAWWPTKTSSDTEKTLAALIEAANRALHLAKIIVYDKCAGTADNGSPQPETRGEIALIAAQDIQQGSVKLISDLDTASNHLKELAGLVRG
jgi:hypothetical protein